MVRQPLMRELLAKSPGEARIAFYVPLKHLMLGCAYYKDRMALNNVPTEVELSLILSE